MSVVSGLRIKDRFWLPVLRHTIGAVAAIISIVPRFTVVTMPVVALLAFVSLPAERKARVPDSLRHPLTITFLVLLAYLILNAAQALDPQAGLMKVLEFSTMLAFAWLAHASMSRFSDAERSYMILPIVRGTFIGAAFLAIEIATDQAIMRFVFNALPFTRPDDAKHMVVEGGQVVSIAPHVLNRHLSLLVLMLWPYLLAASSLYHETSRRAAWVSIIVLLALIAPFSQHESSQIALIGSTAVFAAALFWPSGVRWALMVLWCLAFLLVIPAAKWAYHSAALHKVEWIPVTGRARIILWGYTADQALKHPFLGIGIRSTRVWDARIRDQLVPDEQEVYDRRPGHHAHNMFLQTWFELGLVGVALVMWTGIILLQSVARLAPRAQPFALGLFATFFLTQSFAWGMWQSWYLSTLALTSALLWLIAPCGGRGEGRS